MTDFLKVCGWQLHDSGEERTPGPGRVHYLEICFVPYSDIRKVDTLHKLSLPAVETDRPVIAPVRKIDALDKPKGSWRELCFYC
jgi:hypothetical protein